MRGEFLPHEDTQFSTAIIEVKKIQNPNPTKIPNPLQIWPGEDQLSGQYRARYQLFPWNHMCCRSTSIIVVAMPKPHMEYFLELGIQIHAPNSIPSRVQINDGDEMVTKEEKSGPLCRISYKKATGNQGWNNGRSNLEHER
ncbi:hypothetical protein I7I48_05481 [Histoplasma ohiense]|nr:hypothetical protein I7I48_05481 [Histoplasma ohiense (nom. inval.)]